MSTTKKAVSTANANSFDARLATLEKQIASLVDMLSTQQKSATPPTKAAPKAKATAKKTAKATAKKPANQKDLKVSIPGKPSTVYVEKDWAWIGWTDRPSKTTLQTLKSDGWRYSPKRKQWHKANA